MADARASRWRHSCLRVAALLSVWTGSACGGPGFGSIIEHPLAFTPAGVTVLPGPPGSRSEIVVLAKDRPLLAGHVVTDEGIIVETQTFRAPDRCAAITQGDFNGDGKREFALLSAGGTRVHSYHRHPAGWITRKLGPGMRASKLVSADLNVDGFGDLLCYGRAMAGGIVYYGSRSGLSDSAAVVLADLSIADAVVSDVNGDQVPDLLVADWLGNALTVYLGLDGSTFTEAIRVDVPAEPLEVAIAEATPGSPTVLAVLLGDGTTIRTYSLQKAGEVSLTEETRLDSRGRDLRLLDIDGNRRPEMLISTPSGLLLSELDRGQRSRPWTAYGLFPEPGGVSARDVDGDRKRDLVVAEGARRRLLVCANNSAAGATRWPDVFVTPGEPVAAVLSDVNLDGNDDLVVACRRPPVVAILAGNGRGAYSLEQTVSIPEKPSGLLPVASSRGGTPTVVTSHALLNTLGVVSIDERGNQASVRTIATGERPHVLAATRDSADALQILTMTGAPSSRGHVLSWFDELPNGQFIERPSGLPPSVRIIHAVAGAGRREPVTLAALIRERDRGALRGWTGRPLSSPSEPFGGVPASSSRLLAGAMSAGGDFTVFYHTDGAAGEVGSTTWSASTGQWTAPTLSGNLYPDPAVAAIAVDVTEDGTPDLLFSDRKSRAIVLIQGAADGKPVEPRSLLVAPGARAVAVGEPGVAGARDLVVLRQGMNAASLIREGVRP